MENAQPEPSMEEILASIRRIISEDEEEAAPATTSSGAGSAQKAESKQELQGSPFKQKPAPTAENDTAKTRLETEDVEMIKKNVAEAMDQETDEAILGDASAAAASEAFQNLSQSVRVSDAGPGRTLEDIVVLMLKPLVKDWLDANLPAIVEEKVEEEVQRVARRRRG